MRTFALRALLSAAFAAAFAAPALAQPKPPAIKDKITPKKGNAVEGTITKENFKTVEINPTTGGTMPFAPADIASIEYGDAPASFRQAIADVGQGNYEEALSKINSADADVEQKVVKPLPRAWFAQWVLFYRGKCLREIGRENPSRLDDAIRFLQKLIETHKDSRFLQESYELILECYGDKGDASETEKFLPKIDQAPVEFRPALKKRAQMTQASALLASGKFDEARLIFETLTRDPDKDVAADATSGVIRSLSKAKKADQLKTFCKQVLNGGGDAATLIVASNALADALYEAKTFKDASKQYVDSVVRYHPGRGSPLVREHERALLMLGKCYEELAGAAKDDAAKTSYTIMAGRTYRELSLEYPQGRYFDEAVAKSSALDK